MRGSGGFLTGLAADRIEGEAEFFECCGKQVVDVVVRLGTRAGGEDAKARECLSPGETSASQAAFTTSLGAGFSYASAERHGPESDCCCFGRRHSSMISLTVRPGRGRFHRRCCSAACSSRACAESAKLSRSSHRARRLPAGVQWSGPLSSCRSLGAVPGRRPCPRIGAPTQGCRPGWSCWRFKLLDRRWRSAVLGLPTAPVVQPLQS